CDTHSYPTRRSSDLDPGPDGAVRRPLRRRQLLRLRRVPRRDPEARAAAREVRGRPARGHAEGALGGPALRRQASLPTTAGDLDEIGRHTSELQSLAY